MVGTEIVDHRRLIVAETNPVENGVSRKLRLWVEPDRDFAVVRRAALVKERKEADWKPYTQTDGRRYRQFADDTWLPTEVVFVALQTHPGDEPSTVAWRYELVLHDWRVNQSPPIATFCAVIPAGVWVNDHRKESQGNYRQPAGDDQSLPAEANR